MITVPIRQYQLFKIDTISIRYFASPTKCESIRYNTIALALKIRLSFEIDIAAFCFIFTRTWLRYVRVFAVVILSVCRLSVCLSVVCNVGAPYSGGWTFRRNFFIPLCTLAILWPLCKILRRSSQGNPSVGGVKRKWGIKKTAILDLSKAISHKRYKIDV